MNRLWRAASALLIVLLAGGPAGTSVCEALCAGPPATDASQSQGMHHQAMAAHENDREMTMPHAHHCSATAAQIPGAEPRAHVQASPGRDCCGSLARWRPSVTAARADANLLSPPDGALLVWATSSYALDCRPAGSEYGSPPGSLPAAPTPFVLRI